MNALKRLLNSFEKDGNGWLYYGDVDPKEASQDLARITAERDALFQIAVIATRAVDEMPPKLKPRAAELDHVLATLEPELWERVDAAALKQSS